MMNGSSKHDGDCGSDDSDEKTVTYQYGFGNTFESEAIKGALPKDRNTPRLVPYNLYAEQLSGTAFTSPRESNKRTWTYRIQPSVVGTENSLISVMDDNNEDGSHIFSSKYFGGVNVNDIENEFIINPNPLRWMPMPLPKKDEENKFNFITGMKTFMMSGNPLTKDGLSISMYVINESMKNIHMYNSDGDLLIVPQLGSLLILTELGRIVVKPKEICVLPRGIVFSVHLTGGCDRARGYVLEIYKGHFTLPELGPIGANGLANARNFEHPTAWFVKNKDQYGEGCTIVNKFGNELFKRHSPHSPYNVVAWYGNYTPYKYDLTKFCTVNSVSYDHLDPSIYTVLTCVGHDEPGTALADFVIFPPRIMATDENTFRPPYYHKNTMSEFMGLIEGEYDAKSSNGGGGSSSSNEDENNNESGFVPGGSSLHSTMTPHGPDSTSYERAVQDECKSPTKFNSGLAFMFETSCLFRLSRTNALDGCTHRDGLYAKTCWSNLKDNFAGWEK